MRQRMPHRNNICAEGPACKSFLRSIGGEEPRPVRIAAAAKPGPPNLKMIQFAKTKSYLDRQTG